MTSTTTTSPAWIDELKKVPARVDLSSAAYAQFPALVSLPRAAREPIEAFLKLRDRRADASAACSDAQAAVKQAELADAAGLLEHVRAGGRAYEFRGTTDAAVRNVGFAQADVNALDKLLSEQYHKTARALQGIHDQGAELAATAAEKAATRYSDAITAMASARQDYINAIGVILFWRHLVEKGVSITPGGDQIHLRRGPITKVDNTTLSVLRMDAQTHERAAEAEL
ncbi:MAG: hypothetical protein ACRDTX_30775 [Pseudonocardiaceae bacterium]